jgi:microcystin degradation protein MlrC
MLRRLVERGIRNAVVGPVWDPVAVRIAFDAGEGAQLALRIGGKISPLSGEPLDLQVTVKKLVRNHIQTGLSNTPTPMGDTALVEADGIEILLVTLRNQAIGTDLFTNAGCDLASKKVIVVKSSQHFYASFSRIARHVIYADAPGSVTRDLNTLPFRKVRRPLWPLAAAVR